MITLVVEAQNLLQDEVVVEGSAYRHLFRARRLAVGAEVRLVDGLGAARFSRVIEVGSRQARLLLEGPAPTNEPGRRVELLAPIPRSSRLAWMVEKSTEIGVAAVRLIRTGRGPREAGSLQIRRLQRIAVAAVEQSHRSRVPEITGPHAFDDISRLLASCEQAWVLQPGVGVANRGVGAGGGAVLVGPEGGWTPDEMAALEAAGCRSMSLGPTILRIETAAVVGCSVLLLAPTRDSDALH